MEPIPKRRLVKIGESGYDTRIDRFSKWGNPFVIGVHGNRAKVIALYKEWIVNQPNLVTDPRLKSGLVRLQTSNDWASDRALPAKIVAYRSGVFGFNGYIAGRIYISIQYYSI